MAIKTLKKGKLKEATKGCGTLKVNKSYHGSSIPSCSRVGSRNYANKTRNPCGQEKCTLQMHLKPPNSHRMTRNNTSHFGCK
jgi:hypothetical protein